ncbi:MAG: hypothetical protein WBP89_09850 [Sedimenticolaceae bacterium]
MRRLGRILLVCLVVLPTLMLGQRIWNALHWDQLAAVLSGRIDRALPSNAYLALDDGWLEFTLSAKGDALRVRSNAVMDAQFPFEPRTEWWYAFEFQLLDHAGEVLRQGVYHHRTRATRFRDPDSGRLENRNFLLDPTLRPTDGRSMLVHFNPGQSPAGLRIRPMHMAPPLKSLMFRVYEKTANPTRQLRYQWQRLATSKKVRLARGSVYGVDLLREEEKQNLLRYEWKAVGPLGVEGTQYRSTKLYIARELEGEAIDDGQLPYGLYCDAGLRGMIPIPAGDWPVSLQFISFQEAEAEPADVWVRWYGDGITQRWQTRLPAVSGQYTLGRHFDAGLLEIVATTPLVVRAWGGGADTRRELTPQPLRLRAYLVDTGAALPVDVDHVGSSATPFRVDVRSRLPVSEPLRQRKLNYAFLDASGRRIGGGRLNLDLVPSPFDRLSQAEPGIQLSEPLRFYFALSPEVAQVRFTAQDELLLTTYTRPPDLVHRVRIPEDYQDVAADLDRQPAWFLVRPADEERLRREFHTAMLTLQPRPPETDPRLLAGDYDWTLYQPVGSWRARHILVPRREELPLRDRSRGAVYRELTGGRPQRVHFRSPSGLRAVQPSLLYLREQGTPLDVQVKLGDRLHNATQIAGRHGELQLPAVGPISTHLTIDAGESVRWFINQTDTETPAFLRRLAMQLGEDGLTFEYLKQSHAAEVLSGELYLTSPARVGLRVSIAGAAPTGSEPRREWTFHERLYDIRPEGGEQVPILNSSKRPLRAGQRFFLPLGSDLPPGRYTLSFSLQHADEGFLTLYQLTAGQADLRAFSREPVDVQKAGI